MIQTHQGVCSTKPKPNKSAPTKVAANETHEPLLPCITSSDINIYEDPIRNLYTNECIRFPICKQSGYQYIMIAFHCDYNIILNPPFKMRGDTHCSAVYNSIMQRLTSHGHKVDLQVLDNEVSAAYKKAITETWKAKYQLVPPYAQRRNAAERVIRTFKTYLEFPGENTLWTEGIITQT